MRLRVSSLAELDTDGIKAVEAAGERILLIRKGDSLRAVSAICSHRGGPLAQGLVVDGVLVCPWHRAVYQLESGRALCGPTDQPLTTYAVVIADGDIYVELETSDEPDCRQGPTTGARGRAASGR